jgi:quercetin dioxygenase-like cupin family protein
MPILIKRDNITTICMTQNSSFNMSEGDWEEFVKGNAKGISSKDVDPGGLITAFTIKLMRVEPGGEFPPHVDPYSHLFYLLSGVGEGLLGDNVYAMKPWHVTIVKAGIRHGYRNVGSEDMYLLTMNIPTRT